ncbi:hypothetical protein ACMZ9T_27325, partial [Klebsiella pneumoniae]
WSAAALSAVLALAAGTAQAQPEIPASMDVIVGAKVPTPAQAARQDVLALNTGMFDLYADAGRLVQASILAQHPVILGLFSGAGGRFLL